MGINDQTTIVEYSVMVYYTTQFSNDVTDVAGYINQLIALANVAYVNSGIPLRLKLHCYEEALGLVEDLSSSYNTFNSFAAWKSKTVCISIYKTIIL